MKAGDKVWVPVYVIREFRGHVDLAASERDMHKGNIALTLMVDDIVSPLSDDGPPDHPALCVVPGDADAMSARSETK